MPKISSNEDSLALENSELIEEYPIDLKLNKKQLIRKQILQSLTEVSSIPTPLFLSV